MVHVSHTLGLMSVTVLLRVFFYTDVVPRPICVCVCVWCFFVSFSIFLTIISTETTFIRYK